MQPYIVLLRSPMTVPHAASQHLRAETPIRSPRWPFGRDTFYKMVRAGRIAKHHPYPGSRPVYSVDQIDGLYTNSSENHSGGQNPEG